MTASGWRGMGVAALIGVSAAHAGEVVIEKAAFTKTGSHWRVSVTLRHADTGWDHYADQWRLVDGQGRVLATRVLYHPHVDEQPFTRSQNEVVLPAGLSTVFIEARDTVHGWAKERLTVDLTRPVGERYEVHGPGER